MYKKIIICLLINMIFISFFSTCFSTEDLKINDIVEENQDTNLVQGLDLHSEGAVLIETNSGKVLYDKNMNKRLYPASITKILTAILVIENCDLSEKAIASSEAVNSIPSGYTLAGIKAGEAFTVEQLLQVTMLRSANEAATILAEHVSGSVEEFANLMNAKAKEIGCLDSHFVNANGMHDENHYSTAYDMALIQQYCMKNEEYRRISSLTSCSLPDTDLYEGEPRNFKNTHAFLIKDDENYYKYAISGKTGYTTPAKNCLVTSTDKNGFELTAVVLCSSGKIDGVSARYYDTMQLINYGYDNYRLSNFLEKNSAVETIEIETTEGKKENLKLLLESDIGVICKKDDSISKTDGEVKLNDITLPISKGDILGTITYKINGNEYISNLVADRSIEKATVAQVSFITEKSDDSIIIIMLSTLIIIAIAVVIIFIIVIKNEGKIKLNYN